MTREHADMNCPHCGHPMQLSAARNTFTCANAKSRERACPNAGRSYRISKMVPRERDV